MMIWFLGIAAVIFDTYSAIAVGLGNNALTITCRILLLFTANVMLGLANARYEKLKSRIKALEDKQKEKEKTDE